MPETSHPVLSAHQLHSVGEVLDSIEGIAHRAKETVQDLEHTLWELVQLAEAGTDVTAVLTRLLLSLMWKGGGLDLSDVPGEVKSIRTLLGLAP